MTSLKVLCVAVIVLSSLLTLGSLVLIGAALAAGFTGASFTGQQLIALVALAGVLVVSANLTIQTVRALREVR